MSFPAILLRVLVCVGLLVNGSAQATTLTHAVESFHAAGGATPPCHEAGDAKARMTHSAALHADGTGSSQKPDCCKSGACDCACSHGAVATLPRFDGEGRRVTDLTQASRLGERYASPALPRLIRPPIF